VEEPTLEMPKLEMPSLDSIMAQVAEPAPGVPSEPVVPSRGAVATQTRPPRATGKRRPRQEQVQVMQQQQQAPLSTSQETFKLLDKDGSGWVELQEIQDFAMSQGVSEADMLAEFRTFDRDGNGKLDASELEGMLASSEEPAPATPAMPATPATSASAVRMPMIPDLVAPPLPEVKAPAPAPQLVEAAPKHVSDNATGWLHDSASKSGTLASRAAAEMFARQAQAVLAQRRQEEEQADQLESLALHLRMEKQEIIDSAAASTQNASVQAVQGVIAKSLPQIKDMQEKLRRTEARASEKHHLAEEAMYRAMRSQSDLTILMRRLRGRTPVEGVPASG